MKEQRIKTDFTLIFLKKFTDLVIKLLLKTPITPNQITVISFLICGPLTFYFLVKGGYVNNLIALLLLVIYSFFDLIDGDLARRKNLQSKLGEWLEKNLDNLLQTLVIFGISINILNNFDLPWKYLALLPVFGQSLANVLGLHLTYRFNVDPFTGNKNLDSLFKIKRSFFDKFLRNMVIPTDFIYLFLFTLRFHVLIGIIFNVLPYAFIIFGFFITIRSLFLLLIVCVFYSNSKQIKNYIVFDYLKQHVAS